MIEDDFYRASSQFRLWSFTEASLHSLRSETNATASDRVRAALRRAREARQSTASSAAGTPSAEDTTTAGGDQQPHNIECLTAEEEQQLIRYYCEQIIELGERYKPPLPTIVRATAIQYFRRFYLTNSPMAYHPKTIMPCALFLATKTDNYYLSLRQFAETFPGDATADDIIAPEFLVMQSLRFTFDVRHPFRGLEGGVMELQAIAQGIAHPAPHAPQQTPDDLRRDLLALPSPPPPAVQSSSITDRLARAHHNTRETLKAAAQITDAYFLYTPAQIWLAAFLIADRPMAEFYLSSKLGMPGQEEEEQGGGGAGNPLYELRTKMFATVNKCADLLQSYTPLASDPEQKKNLRAIGKKLYHCQNPEKANISGQKRIPAAAAAAAAAVSSGGDPGTSESEIERLAKKRKLEGSKKDLFGGDLVMQRTKENQADEQ
ncbi:hypothetical protein FE257_005278 [Aspergillus nanangensis]|uniref:RNA polymerase II holoenzyme cyclin-like subunit n=1 Tax=Aspergillus nanangensis TaxID=2582783 RepID=A0AAD4CR27_ASPNN|nr:hypothetical protein FE257_005278 [Aspergillus nanangensis]